MQKINCGGFYIDENDFNIDEEGKLSLNDRVDNDFVVTYSTSDMTTWTCDKTFAQISVAMAAGKQVVLLGNMSEMPFMQGSDILLSNDGEHSYIEFWIRVSKTLWYRAKHFDDNSIEVHESDIDYDAVGAVSAYQGFVNAKKVLMVNDTGWVVPKDKRFLVTLSPTAQDFSGEMDKTIAEINEAWEEGKEIWFRIYEGTNFTDVPCDRIGKMAGLLYPSFNATMLYDETNMFVMIYTGTGNDGSRQTYSTKLYPITPATQGAES